MRKNSANVKVSLGFSAGSCIRGSIGVRWKRARRGEAGADFCHLGITLLQRHERCFIATIGIIIVLYKPL